MLYKKLSELQILTQIMHFGPSSETFTGRWYMELSHLMADSDLSPVLRDAEKNSGCPSDAARGYLASCLDMGKGLYCEPEIRSYFQQLHDVASVALRRELSSDQP
jgi:hypothetical protein